MTENRAATAWASAQSHAATLAADLDCGDNVSYDAAEDMGEQVFRELQVSLRNRDMVLIDDGDGHEVRSAVSAPDPAHDVAGNGSECHYDSIATVTTKGAK